MAVISLADSASRANRVKCASARTAKEMAVSAEKKPESAGRKFANGQGKTSAALPIGNENNEQLSTNKKKRPPLVQLRNNG